MNIERLETAARAAAEQIGMSMFASAKDLGDENQRRREAFTQALLDLDADDILRLLAVVRAAQMAHHALTDQRDVFLAERALRSALEELKP